MVQSFDSIDQTIDQGEFYLKISNLYATTYDLTNVTIEPKMSYEKMYKTTATLWIGDAEDQPVVKVDKEEIIEGDFNVVIRKKLMKTEIYYLVQHLQCKPKTVN